VLGALAVISTSDTHPNTNCITLNDTAANSFGVTDTFANTYTHSTQCAICFHQKQSSDNLFDARGFERHDRKGP
jgi:hypothetical protein